MSQFILSIDIGTTSAKALAVLADGTVIRNLQQFYTTHYPQEGYAEQDAQEILNAVEWLVRETVDQIKKNPTAIVFSSAMHGLMAVDDKGQTLTKLLLWGDTRSKEQAHELKNSEEGLKIYQRTGTPIHPMSPLCKLAWIRKHQPDVFQKAYKFISIKEFIIFHWTGEFVVDYSIASATGLLDSQDLIWSDAALTYTSVSVSRLSKLVAPSHAVALKPSMAKHLHLNQDTMLLVGASDGCLAQLGSGALKEGEMTITVGTSGAVRVFSSIFQVDQSQRTFTYLLESGQYISGGAINSGTAVLDWFAKEFNAVNLTALADQVKHLPAGNDGLISLPHLLGERAPSNLSDARGVFYGVSMHHTRLHFQRAMLEGICYQLKSVVDVVEEIYGAQPHAIVSGGIIRSSVWLQMLSDVLNKPLIVKEQHDASSLGAAILAFNALGLSWDHLTPESALIIPNSTHRKLYDKAYLTFKQLNRQLHPLFDAANH